MKIFICVVSNGWEERAFATSAESVEDAARSFVDMLATKCIESPLTTHQCNSDIDAWHRVHPDTWVYNGASVSVHELILMDGAVLVTMWNKKGE